MVQYILDTNICIYISKKQPRHVLERFEKLQVNSVGMSVITYGELFFGAQKSQNSVKALDSLAQISSYIPPLPISMKVGSIYGNIREHLEKKGTPIGSNDLWIAAHALDLGAILVTNNQKEFNRVPLLLTENWVEIETA